MRSTGIVGRILHLAPRVDRLVAASQVEGVLVVAAVSRTQRIGVYLSEQRRQAECARNREPGALVFDSS